MHMTADGRQNTHMTADGTTILAACSPHKGGRRMTGSAQTRSGVYRFIMLLGEKKKGRVWEGKGLGVGRGGRGGGFENR